MKEALAICGLIILAVFAALAGVAAFVAFIFAYFAMLGVAFASAVKAFMWMLGA